MATGSLITVIKDGWDYADVIVPAILSIISMGLVVACSALVSDWIKDRNRKIDALNYLSICSYNYFAYLLRLRNTLIHKRNSMQRWINEPEFGNTEEGSQTFWEVIPPNDNFDVKISDYAFTVQNYPNIVNCLVKYLHLYKESIGKIQNMNNELHSAFVNEDLRGRIATAYAENNPRTRVLASCEASVCEAIYRLHQVREAIFGYAKSKNITKEFAHINITNNGIIVEIKQYLDNLKQSSDWHIDLEDNIEPTKIEKFLDFVRKIFSITNTTTENKHKIVRILGLKFQFRVKRK